MLLVDVHQLDVILADAISCVVLEHQVDNIRRIFSLDCEDVLILGGTKNLGKRSEVDTEGNVAITTERGEGFRAKKHGDEGNVGVVHGLESDARVIAVKVTILDKVLDCVHDLEDCQKSTNVMYMTMIVPS